MIESAIAPPSGDGSSIADGGSALLVGVDTAFSV
jgi:hypothetical protein